MGKTRRQRGELTRTTAPPRQFLFLPLYKAVAEGKPLLTFAFFLSKKKRASSAFFWVRRFTLLKVCSRASNRRRKKSLVVEGFGLLQSCFSRAKLPVQAMQDIANRACLTCPWMFSTAS